MNRKDLKGATQAVYAAASTSATAASTGDVTTINGAVIDTMTIEGDSVSFELPCVATLAATFNLTVKGTIEHSTATDTGFTAVVAEATLLTLAGGTAGGVKSGVARMGVALEKCLRYVRATYLPDLSRTGTDTAVLGAGVAVIMPQET
jgi:hypothetical protein